MSEKSSGYREIEHTADWELEVWAPDLSGLLEQALRGMYALAGIQLLEEPILTRSLTITVNDKEEMLISFLAELLFIVEDEGIGFDKLDLKFRKNTLVANLTGAPIAEQMKEIKAVTYHNLKIVKTDEGYRTAIVFDV